MFGGVFIPIPVQHQVLWLYDVLWAAGIYATQSWMGWGYSYICHYKSCMGNFYITIDRMEKVESGYLCEVLHYLLNNRLRTSLVKLAVDQLDVDQETALDLLCALFKHCKCQEMHVLSHWAISLASTCSLKQWHILLVHNSIVMLTGIDVEKHSYAVMQLNCWTLLCMCRFQWLLLTCVVYYPLGHSEAKKTQ